MSSTSSPAPTGSSAAAAGDLPGQWLITQLHGFRRDADSRRLAALMAAEVSPFRLSPAATLH